MIGRQIRRLHRLWSYARVFSSLGSLRRYRQLQFEPEDLPMTVELSIRALRGRRVLCRSRSTDVDTLWETYNGGYHLPRRPLRNPACIVDLGANVGYTAAHFATIYPSARIVAVEMDDRNCALLSKNVASFAPRVTVVQAAVWSRDGVVCYAEADTNAFRVAQSNGDNGASLRNVTAQTIESIFHNNDVRSVDYLKMDIEGAEAEILQGPMEWARVVQQISVEIHAPATVRECESVLHGIGFKCERHPRHRQAIVAYRD